MKIGLAIQIFSDTNLRLTRQIGVTDVVYYNMKSMPTDYHELLHLRTQIEDIGLRLSVIEGGPPKDRIVLGQAGRDNDIEHYKRAIDIMGRVGIPVLCYNWMPQSVEVIRTSFTTPERGGALTSSFNADLFANAPLAPEAPHSDEQMWDNLEYFLRRIVPVAEDAAVKLAMHPDDPPLSPMCGMSRIMRSVNNFEQMLSLYSSPSNTICFCQGCFAEMGVDIPETIHRLGRHVSFVHFRDVWGDVNNFRETFPDNGKTDMYSAMMAWKEIGYEGVLRPDHVPLLEGEKGEEDPGYSMLGRLYAVGYMRGLMESLGITG